MTIGHWKSFARLLCEIQYKYYYRFDDDSSESYVISMLLSHCLLIQKNYFVKWWVYDMEAHFFPP